MCIRDRHYARHVAERERRQALSQPMGQRVQRPTGSSGAEADLREIQRAFANARNGGIKAAKQILASPR
eukprot:8889122-Alexandrium_andersonii.AAC.1